VETVISLPLMLLYGLCVARPEPLVDFPQSLVILISTSDLRVPIDSSSLYSPSFYAIFAWAGGMGMGGRGGMGGTQGVGCLLNQRKAAHML
jgi:hypothetical protein